MSLFGERRRRERFQREALVHMDALYGLALRLSKHERDAEDLVQDAYLKAYQHFDKYREGTNCKAWLFKILTNTFINRYRKRQRENTFLAEDAAPSPLERLAAKVPNPVRQSAASQTELFQRLFGDEVSRALEKVPVDFRMCVLLVDLYGFSYKETADIIGCPIGTVMSRLYRGRRLLQTMLVEYAIHEGIIDAEKHRDKLGDSVGDSGSNSGSDTNVVEFKPRRQGTAS
jgi:RNA polymerase sigma-70 factor, ECF subfamily